MGEILGFLLLAAFFGGLPWTVACIRLKADEKLAALFPGSTGVVLLALLSAAWITT